MKSTSESKDNENWQKWQPEIFEPKENPVASSAPVISVTDVPPTAQPLTESVDETRYEQQRQQAWQEGYQQGLITGEQNGHQNGYQAGLLAAEQQAEQRIRQEQTEQQQIRRLADGFANSLQVLDGVITSRLLQLALQIALQITGEAIKCDSHQLAEQIRTLLEQDPLFGGVPILRVHPQDLPLAEQLFADQITARGWQLSGDPRLRQGDCLLQGEESELDCSITTRWLELCQRARKGAY